MSGLVSTWALASQPLWPSPVFDVSDVFDRPPWERPTDDTGYTPPDFIETFGGAPGWGNSPGFTGGGSGAGIGGNAGVGAGSGFQGGLGTHIAWSPGSGGGGGTFVIVNTTGVHTIDITADRRLFYRIEVHDADNELISNVPGWISGKLKIQVDKASELEFTVPIDSEGAGDLARPNTVWVRDRWGFVVDTFTIQKRRPYGTGDASYLTVNCTSAISQLGEEVVIEYDGGDVTVGAHVVALLNLQEKTNALTLGTIDPEIADIATPLFASDTSIHNALLSLQAALPKDQRGHIYVDPQRRVQWRLLIGDQTEQVITRTSNVSGIQAETDYSQLYNRVYMYGEGNDPGTRLTLIDAGEPELYVENTTSQTAYGLRPLQKQDRRIRNSETLLRVANRILEEFGTPPVTVTVDLLDIAKADNAPAGWQDIFIGGKYRVVDTDLALDTSIEIVGIEVDMARPVPLRVDLTNQTRDLSDLLSRLIGALQQPLYVDGDRYPTMGRNYSGGVTADNLRAGDTRWNDSEAQAEMYDGDSWEPMGGGEEYHFEASTKAGLTDASTVPASAIGRVDGVGSDNGMFCVPNPAKNGWDALNFFE